MPPGSTRPGCGAGPGTRGDTVSRDGPATPPAGANVPQRLIVVALLWGAVTWRWLRDTVLNF